MSPNQWNTVAIAGLDGYALGKTTFTPLPTPYVGCAGPVLPISAHVAAGKVYFADGAGVIRSLSVTGQVTQIATFPLTSSQQMLSFAVSPDGSKLLATIFTIPPKPASGDPCSGGGAAFAPGDFTLAMYYAEPGRAAAPLWNTSWPQGSSSIQLTALVGWDNVGPIATYPTGWATQGGGPVHYWGTPVRLDYVTGKMLGPVGDPTTCPVWDIAASGDFVCALGTGELSVRRRDGSEIWRVAGQPNSGYELAFLSPDEQHLVALGAGSEVLGPGGTDIKLPAAFSHDGWLDSGTVIGGGFNTNLNYVSIGSPGVVVDIGFHGLFIGTVQA